MKEQQKMAATERCFVYKQRVLGVRYFQKEFVKGTRFLLGFTRFFLTFLSRFACLERVYWSTRVNSKAGS